MMNLLTAATWSPYLAGAGIGILLGLSMLLSGKPLGCGAAFTGAAGLVESIFRGWKTVSEKPYFRMFPLRVEWQWMFVLGIFIGAFLSAVLSGTFQITWVPSVFAGKFGDSPLLRIITAIIGGILVGLGARWCWGCPSSHGISGIPQLSLASFVAVACMFALGIGTALILFGM
jgi:uncharacterized membrane protein YedE/YeeE